MKRILFLLFWVLSLNVTVRAQHWDLTVLPFNSSDAGWYGTINLGRTNLSNTRFYAGLTFHYNQTNMPDRDTGLYLHKRFRALNTANYIGLNVGAQKNLNLFKSKYLTTFVSYDLTVRNIGAESFRAVPQFIYYDSTENVAYQWSRVETTTIKNLWSFENTLGAGLNVSMNKHFDFVTTFGLGLNFIFNVPYPVSANSVVAEHFFKYNLGVRYKF